MRLHRFIVNFKLKQGSLKLEDPGLFNQLRNVLRLEAGEKIILGDGESNEAEANIKAYGKDFVNVEVESVNRNQNEPDTDVVLYCAVLKKENFELVVQKATEIGVKEIVPVITDRTIKLNIRQDRLEKIIREASEQSGRGTVPVLHEPVDFSKAIMGSKNNYLNLFFDQSGESLNSSKRLISNGLTGVWIGPEGGWTSRELESARESDFKIVNLGKLILRAETAAITATFVVVHNFFCR